MRLLTRAARHPAMSVLALLGLTMMGMALWPSDGDVPPGAWTPWPSQRPESASAWPWLGAALRHASTYWTAPMGHLGLSHAAGNGLAFAALWGMTALSRNSGRLARAVLALWPLPQLVLPFTSSWPWVAGASGVLHLWLGLLALAWMRDPRRPWRLTGQWLLLALLLKVLLEPFLASQGALPDWVAWPLHGTGLIVALVWSGISHKRAA